MVCLGVDAGFGFGFNVREREFIGMPQTVLLTEIVEALEFQVDEGLSVIDVEKGEVVYVSRDLLSMAEEGTRTKAKRVWMMMSGRKPSG